MPEPTKGFDPWANEPPTADTREEEEAPAHNELPEGSEITREVTSIGPPGLDIGGDRNWVEITEWRATADPEGFIVEITFDEVERLFKQLLGGK